MRTEELTYGMCVHGNNLARCKECNLNGQFSNQKIEFEKNDPIYSYFIEQKLTGGWLVQSNDNAYKDITLTKIPTEALVFDGDEGRALANIFLTFHQIGGNLKDFVVTEHMFI